MTDLGTLGGSASHGLDINENGPVADSLIEVGIKVGVSYLDIRLFYSITHIIKI